MGSRVQRHRPQAACPAWPPAPGRDVAVSLIRTGTTVSASLTPGSVSQDRHVGPVHNADCRLSRADCQTTPIPDSSSGRGPRGRGGASAAHGTMSPPPDKATTTVGVLGALPDPHTHLQTRANVFSRIAKQRHAQQRPALPEMKGNIRRMDVPA